MEISLENLYVDTGAERVKVKFFFLNFRIEILNSKKQCSRIGDLMIS